MKSKILIVEFFILTIIMLAVAGIVVIKVDPYFHYHKPYTEKYFYMLGNPRSQNDGICRHFDYNTLITGTSMAENFKTTEADTIFGVNSIKVPYPGATYKEINDSLARALKYNKGLKYIIRGLDMERFMDSKDLMRCDLGVFPTYLYDDNYFNDIEYVFNRDVIFGQVYPMLITNREEGVEPGIRTFDVYSNWMPANYPFGANAVLRSRINTITENVLLAHLTKDEEKILLDNIQQNVTSLAAEYPDVTFYYFFTPYSAAWWMELMEKRAIDRQLLIERKVIEEILKYDNIKLYSFNNRMDITTDLNHYKDTRHYGEWINSLMLRWMYEDVGLLTEDNYEEYLREEYALYTEYDYRRLRNQDDYENDYFAAALLCSEINKITPFSCSEVFFQEENIKSADILENLYNGAIGIECHGGVQREPESDVPLEEYLYGDKYIGCKAVIADITDYNYLVFYGKKTSDKGQPGVYLYDGSGNFLSKYEKGYINLDDEWHQYMLNVSDLEGKITIIFNGGFADNLEEEDISYLFCDVMLY